MLRPRCSHFHFSPFSQWSCLLRLASSFPPMAVGLSTCLLVEVSFYYYLMNSGLSQSVRHIGPNGSGGHKFGVTGVYSLRNKDGFSSPFQLLIFKVLPSLSTLVARSLHSMPTSLRRLATEPSPRMRTGSLPLASGPQPPLLPTITPTTTARSLVVAAATAAGPASRSCTLVEAAFAIL